VQTIVAASQNWELSPEEIASDYDLTKSQVQEALEFYEAHRDEIEAAITAEEKLAPDHA